ncbi:MAG: hypothetical protein WC875_04280, partial [Candidatus Absconditabacterales bacterium]
DREKYLATIDYRGHSIATRIWMYASKKFPGVRHISHLRHYLYSPCPYGQNQKGGEKKKKLTYRIFDEPVFVLIEKEMD